MPAWLEEILPPSALYRTESRARFGKKAAPPEMEGIFDLGRPGWQNQGTQPVLPPLDAESVIALEHASPKGIRCLAATQSNAPCSIVGGTREVFCWRNNRQRDP